MHGLIHWQDQWLAFTHDQQRVHEKRLLQGAVWFTNIPKTAFQTHNGHFDYWSLVSPSSKSWDLHLHFRSVPLLKQSYITLDIKFLSLWQLPFDHLLAVTSWLQERKLHRAQQRQK
ncbi:hypothetical protein ACJX0J_014904, partial [Zea mays]